MAVHADPPRMQDDADAELLRFAIDSALEGLLIVDSDLKILYANPAAAGMVGFPARKLRGADVLDSRWNLVHESGKAVSRGERQSIVAALRGEAPAEELIGVRRPGGKSELWLEVSAVPFAADSAKELPPRKILVRLKDVTERKRTQDRLAKRVGVLNALNDYALRLEETPFDRAYPLIAEESRRIFGAGAAAIAIYDDAKRSLILQNIAWSKDLERSALRHLGDEAVKELAAPVGEAEIRAMTAKKVGVSSNLYEFSFGKVPSSISEMIERTLGIGWFRGMILTTHGRLFGGLGLAGLKGDEAPEIEELLAFAEITANAIMRKHAEEKVKDLLDEKDALLREVHHRIKNNMSTMNSILSLQAGAACEPAAKAALHDAAVRFQSMNTLYDKLFLQMDLRESNLLVYLSALAREIADIFPGGTSVKIESKGQDVTIGVKTLSTLGIIANEIITNSMKYAFAGRDGGKIILAVRLMEDRVILEIGDDGVGMPESASPGKASGFGLKLIDIMARQIDASVSIERRKGTRYILEFVRR
jgi:PAS domain S-box-containing protein